MTDPPTTTTNKIVVDTIIPGNRVRHNSAHTSPEGSTNDHAKTKMGDATRATIPRIAIQPNRSTNRRCMKRLQ